MIYPIVAYGTPVLKKKAKEIEKEGEINVAQLVEDMFETMYAANGVGLAGPQIGKALRIFVVDAEALDEENLKGFKKAFINPIMVEEHGEKWAFEEGCLSIPSIRENVVRHNTITIKYFDENWEEHEDTFDDLKARVIQHEYDHIEGILFTDHLSSLKKRLLKGKLNNISKGKVEHDYRMKFPEKK